MAQTIRNPASGQPEEAWKRYMTGQERQNKDIPVKDLITKDTAQAMGSEEIITAPLDRRVLDHVDTIDRLFFAYRDFTAEADRQLEKLGFGRAHHRALYFINRRPGMMVAELIDILAITKQSLSRVLRQLIDDGYIAQQEGAEDRRQRLLYPTAKGRDLILALSGPQSRRMEGALAASPRSEDAKTVSAFLEEMIDDKGRSHLKSLED